MAGKNNSSIDSRISDLISRIDTLVDKIDNSKKESASSSKPATPKERLTEDLEKKREAEKQLEFSKQLAASEKERQEIEAKLLSSKLQQIEVELELSRINGATEEQLNVIIERYKEARVKIEEYNESIIFTAESTEIGKNFANNLANSIGLVETKTAKTAKALLSPKGLNNALSGFGKQAKNLVKPLNVAANLFDQFYQNSVKLMKSIDTNSSQAKRTFGEFGNEISRQAIKNEGSLRRFNMSMDKSFEIQTTMANTLAIYRKASDEQISSLGYQIALQEKLGVSVEDSSTTFENLTTTMGHTPEAAQKISRSFLAMSNKTKVPLQLINKVFNENNKQLLMFGKNANKVALELAYLEGNAKINSSTLADMGDRFMKFEEASKAVSGLNNVLGGTYLSIDEIQQLGDDPVEIVKKIGGAIEASGKSIDEFLESRQMVAAAAEELPGYSAEELTKQLKAFQRGELDAAEASASLALQTNLTTEEMERQAKATMSLTEDISAGLGRINIPGWLGGKMHDFAKGITSSFADMPATIISATSAINGFINKYRAIRAAASAGSTAASLAGSAGSTAASLAGSAGSAGSTAASLAGSVGSAASAGSTAVGLADLAGTAGTTVAQNPGMVDAVIKATGLGADEAAKFIDEGIEVAGKVGQSSSDLVEAMTTNATGPAAAGIYEKGAKALRFIRNLPIIRQVMNFSQGVAAKLGANLPFLGSVLSAGSGVFRLNNNDTKGAFLDFLAAGAVGTGNSEIAIPLNLANLIMDFTSFDEGLAGAFAGLKGRMFGGPTKKYAAGTGGFVQGKTNAIIGESGPEMVLPMNKMGAFLAEPIRAAIEQFTLNSPTNIVRGEQNTPVNAKIEITLNGQVLKDFVLKTVGAELTPLV